MPPHRPDLSDHIIHLTRHYEGSIAQGNLISILSSGRIEARNPYGIAVRHLEQIGCEGPEYMDCQKVTCFSEVPLDCLPGLLDPGVWRKIQLQPYGLIFPRDYLRDKGACQVWYANTYPGDLGQEWAAHSVNALIDAAALDAEGNPDPNRWRESPIAKVTPFFETIGKWWDNYRGRWKTKDFAFEREWRYPGDFDFSLESLAYVAAPPDDWDSIRAALIEEGVAVEDVADLAFHPLERPGIMDILSLLQEGP